jgi:hypothetical protein
MTSTILKRDVFHVTGDMETNQDTMRILADIGQNICAAWSTSDTIDDNQRMNEQLFVIFNTLQANLRAYNALITEAAHFKEAKA